MLHLEAIEPATLELLKRLQALPTFAANTASPPCRSRASCRTWPRRAARNIGLNSCSVEIRRLPSNVIYFPMSKQRKILIKSRKDPKEKTDGEPF